MKFAVIDGNGFRCAFKEWCYANFELAKLEDCDFMICPSCDGAQHSCHCDGNAKLVRLRSAGR